MAYGITLRNDIGTAVLSTEVFKGYEYHSTLTVSDRLWYYNGDTSTISLTGANESYGLQNCTERPIVFVSVSSMPSSPAYSDTKHMVCVTGIAASSTSGYDWEIYIQRGYDEITSASAPISLIVFAPVSQTANGAYGMRLRNSSGDVTFDSTRQMLMPKVAGAFTSQVSVDNIAYVDISTYALSTPAFFSPNIYRYRSGSSGGGIYCVAYHSLMYGFMNSGDDFAIGLLRVGHQVDNNPSNWDQCSTAGYQGAYWDTNAGIYAPYFLIDADDYS